MQYSEPNIKPLLIIVLIFMPVAIYTAGKALSDEHKCDKAKTDVENGYSFYIDDEKADINLVDLWDYRDYISIDDDLKEVRITTKN